MSGECSRLTWIPVESLQLEVWFFFNKGELVYKSPALHQTSPAQATALILGRKLIHHSSLQDFDSSAIRVWFWWACNSNQSRWLAGVVVWGILHLLRGGWSHAERRACIQYISQSVGCRSIGMRWNSCEIVCPWMCCSQGAFGKFPHGKRDGFSTMNILTLEQFLPFEGDSYNFPTHKRGLCQEGMLFMPLVVDMGWLIVQSVGGRVLGWLHSHPGVILGLQCAAPVQVSLLSWGLVACWEESIE